MNGSCRQRGVALLTVLMIVAIVAVIAVAMSGRLQLQLQRQQNMQQQQQAFWYGMAAEAFARVLLRRSLQDEATVHLGQDWAQQGASFMVEDGQIAGEILDLHSCFNLNALQQQPERTQAGQPQQTLAQRSFQRLLEQAVPELNMPAEYLTARISDWLDEDSLLNTAGGAEQDDYASLQFPYYTANSLMVSESELRLMLDLTPLDYQLLRPYICVIPQSNVLKLNVNTLTEETAVLLAALLPELSPAQAQEAILSRPEDGFGDIESFLQSPALAGITVPEEVKSVLTVKSEHFKLQATTAYLESGFRLTVIFKREENNAIRVLARRFGGQG
ncbi:type II secretion system minor pseudopilin GspK [Alishewanella longhuensis]